GSAVSSAPFTVTSSNGAPSIAGFAPTIATPGTLVSITGNNFEPTPTNNRLRFNIVPAPITSSTGTNIFVQVPGGATSGRLSLATPGGAPQRADDFFVPPSAEHRSQRCVYRPRRDRWHDGQRHHQH